MTTNDSPHRETTAKLLIVDSVADVYIYNDKLIMTEYQDYTTKVGKYTSNEDH